MVMPYLEKCRGFKTEPAAVFWVTDRKNRFAPKLFSRQKTFRNQF
jgi:hypothetical protein